MMIILALSLGAFLAYANGANDNFKGVATLLGSGSTDYKKALLWGTGATLLGSLTAFVLSQGLLATFSGKGLIPDHILTLKSFPIAVVLASAGTVMLATRLGFPISTTHALTGALVGAGWVASSAGVNWAKLGGSFFLPLITSPLLAILGAVTLYPIFRSFRKRAGITKETCICVGAEVIAVVPPGASAAEALALARTVSLPSVAVGQEAHCQDRYSGAFLGISAPQALGFFHYFSAGVVSFARGLNDTPKIAALLLLGGALSPGIAIITVASLMAVGGLISAKAVAETMAHKVTGMNAGQGFTANLVTGIIVIFASKLGLPVSTTHVSVGSLFGIGTVNGQAHWRTIAGILLAWITTLPLAAALAATLFLLLRGFLG